MSETTQNVQAATSTNQRRLKGGFCEGMGCYYTLGILGCCSLPAFLGLLGAIGGGYLIINTAKVHFGHHHKSTNGGYHRTLERPISQQPGLTLR